MPKVWIRYKVRRTAERAQTPAKSAWIRVSSREVREKMWIPWKTKTTCISHIGTSTGEEDIWSTWGSIVTDWEAAQKRKNPTVKELVRKGIPHHFRAIVWQLLCGASEADKRQYADYIKATSACEKVIRRDIARTYPEHDFFKEKDGLGQEALFNVMKAYSLHDREVGYCQGSGFIVGLLLMQVKCCPFAKPIVRTWNASVWFFNFRCPKRKRLPF